MNSSCFRLLDKSVVVGEIEIGHSLGYVRGICGLGPSPMARLIGGTVKAMTGPMLPTTRDQKMAGLLRAAHRM